MPSRSVFPDEPLSERDQRIAEGEGTDDAGLWIGLPEERAARRVSAGGKTDG